MSAGGVDTVVGAYGYALTRVFILAAALSACMIFGALCQEWRSINKNGGLPTKDVAVDAGTGC